jgi:hypothetical protein
VQTAIKASPEIVRDYSRLFVNRGAYTVQSLRPHPETRRHYYFRPKAKGREHPEKSLSRWRRKVPPC